MTQPAPASAPDQDNTLYLVDGSGYIFRAFHALPPMTRSDGTPVNAVYGFTSMLIKLLADTQAKGIAVIFDAGRQTFRNRMYDGYKANRPEPPDELRPQFALIRDATRAFNLPCLEQEDYEADDLIATYARQARAAGMEVIIVSSDKDLMQLVGDGIRMLDPIKNRPIGPQEVAERFGVPPEKVADVLALVGDTSDNVPGVPGIGVKTAAQLISEYGDLENLLAHASEIKQPKRRENLIQHADQVRLSRRLVELDTNVPLEVPLEDLGVHTPDPESLRAFLEANAFRSLLARVGDTVAAARAKADSEAPAAGVCATEPAAAAGAEPAYELVQDLPRLQAWVAEAFEAGLVAVVVQATSEDPVGCELVGISLALAPGRACYIPLAHRARPAEGGLDLESARAPRQIPVDQALAALKPLLEHPGVLKTGRNAKLDRMVLARCGIALGPVDDTMLLSYVLEGGLHGHGADELAELHLGISTTKLRDIVGSGRAQVDFDSVDLDKVRNYAAQDADVTLRLHRLLKPRLPLDHVTTVYETLERPLIPVLADMENAGIRVDRDALRRLSNDFAQRIAELERQIFRLAGREFTIGSPKQLGEILFDEMSLEGAKKGKSGAYGTAADILEMLAAQGHELPARVLDWRQLTKLKNTYTDALQDQINPRTGRVHTRYAQAVASTGRLSSTDPNLQNIPVRSPEGRKIRNAFVAEPGYKLLSVDYSQIELRLAAHIAEVEGLRQAFRAGQDIHAITASQVFGIPVEGMDPLVRRKAKAINFGIIYGISPFGLGNQLGIPQAEAKAYIEAYFARYPGIRDYMQRTTAACRQRGFVETLFGRRVHVPSINDKNPARRNFGERAAINAPIQGSAADIIKRAMIRVPPALLGAGLSGRLLLQVHDELLFEVLEAQIEATGALVKQVMEEACDPVLELTVPLVADVGVGDNWAEAH